MLIISDSSISISACLAHMRAIWGFQFFAETIPPYFDTIIIEYNDIAHLFLRRRLWLLSFFWALLVRDYYNLTLRYLLLLQLFRGRISWWLQNLEDFFHVHCLFEGWVTCLLGESIAATLKLSTYLIFLGHLIINFGHIIHVIVCLIRYFSIDRYNLFNGVEFKFLVLIRRSLFHNKNHGLALYIRIVINSVVEVEVNHDHSVHSQRTAHGILEV